MNSIPGNPDIVLWNGYVSDYMDIKNEVVPIKTGVECESFIIDQLVAYECRLKKDFNLTNEELSEIQKAAKELKKGRKREILNQWVEDSELKRWYGNSIQTKYVINAKPRGIKISDYAGSISY